MTTSPVTGTTDARQQRQQVLSNQAWSLAFPGSLRRGLRHRPGSPPAPVPLVKRRRRREARRAQATRSLSTSKFGAAAAPHQHAEFGADHRSRSECAAEQRDSGIAFRARACIPSVGSAVYRPQHEDADPFGPARPSSAQLGPPRLGSPPLSLLPRSTHAEFRMRAPAARCKATRVGHPSSRPLGRSLCLAAALP